MSPCSVKALAELSVIKSDNVKTLRCRPTTIVRGNITTASLSSVTERYTGLLRASFSRSLSRLFTLNNSSNNTQPGVLARISKRR